MPQGLTDLVKPAILKKSSTPQPLMAKFVSPKLIYKFADNSPYDEEHPKYDRFIPEFEGKFHLVDCLVVNRDGNRHPHLLGGGVPIVVDDLVLIEDDEELQPGPKFINVNKIGDPIKTYVCVEDISVVSNESGVTTIILRNGCRLTASLDIDTLTKAMYLCYRPPFST